MAEELKACPFCGGKKISYSTHQIGIAVGCDSCGAVCEIKGSKEQCAAAWNTRAQLPSCPAKVGEAVEVVAYLCNGGKRVLLAADKKEAVWNAGHPLMEVAQHQRILAAACQPGSAVPVRVTGSLDEIDAQTWPFINEEARKVGAEKGSIEAYQYERANGGVVVLWDGPRVHAMAVTIRDDLNRTRCIRMLADTHPADQVAEGVVVSRELLEQMLRDVSETNLCARAIRALLSKSEGVKP